MSKNVYSVTEFKQGYKMEIRKNTSAEICFNCDWSRSTAGEDLYCQFNNNYIPVYPNNYCENFKQG